MYSYLHRKGGAPRTALVIFGAILSVAVAAAAAQAQIAYQSKSKFRQRSSPLSRSLVERPTGSSLPPVASPDINWVQCPAEAQALGATCGRLPVPLDRHHPEGKKVRIYLEIG